MNNSTLTGRQRFNKPFMWFIMGCAAAACVSSAVGLPLRTLDAQFWLIACLTVAFGSRVGIQIPQIKSEITVSDTLVFLILLLYGGDAAVLVAAAEAFVSSFRFNKRWSTRFFNASLLAVATFVTARVLSGCFGSVTELTAGADVSARFMTAVCLMALTQYFVNSGVAAFRESLKHGLRFGDTWRDYYLWTSITYLAGASAAGVTARLVGLRSFFAVLITVPIISIIYFTYRTYLRSVQTSQAQAEQAQRHVEELNRYIAEQDRIREQFVEVEKMSALGQLASGVAHDFNNSLASILGRAELLMKRPDDPDRVRRGLEIIIKSAKDGANTVKRIQDFARQRRDQDFSPVNLDQILLDVMEITRPRWKNRAEAENVHITFELQNDSGAAVMGDESELREVLVNMIFNAVDAMPAGGRICLSAAHDGEHVEVCVSDNGSGMSPEVRSRVFDPFFTTKGVEGMGLGLAVSYGIISRHGGTIRIESDLGAGTTFRITLPASAARGVNVISAEFGARKKRNTRSDMIRFLVVDDEAAVRSLLCELLEEEGFEAVPASGGQEGLTLIEREHFDAVFTDVGMPGMNGWEFARLLRERRPTIPLAVITGWGQTVGNDEREAALVDWVLTKPFSMGQIEELTREVIRDHRRRATLDSCLSQAVGAQAG